MSQQNFQFGKQKSTESSTILQLFTVIILLSLEWNSLQFQDHLCYQLQQHGIFSITGPRKKLNSLAQVDIFRKYFQLLLSIPYISYWIIAVIRHKPPWLLYIKVFLQDLIKTEGINSHLTISEKVTITYPFLSNKLEPFSGSFFWQHPLRHIGQHIEQLHNFLETSRTYKMSNQNTSSNKRRKGDDTGTTDSNEDQHNTLSDMASRSLMLFQQLLSQMQEISTPYPDFNTIVLLLRQQSHTITEDTVRAFFQKHVNSIRIVSPVPPASLCRAVQTIINRCQVASASSTHLTVAAVHLLALVWSAYKAVNVQYRKELLDREFSTIVPKLNTFTMPHSSVGIVKQALQLIYFAQKSLLDTEVMTIHNSILGLLPQVSHSRAATMVIVVGDDASRHIPEMLMCCLDLFDKVQPIPDEIPANRSTSNWSSPVREVGAEFPELPTAPKSSDIWKLSTKTAPITAPPTPHSIRLPYPIKVKSWSPSQEALARESSFQRRTSLSGEQHTIIPEDYSHMEDCIRYDEATIITRFIWVLGLHPGNRLADDNLNRCTTIGEHQHVVRMLGTLSEHPQGNSQLTYSNGLTLDLQFSTDNFTYIYDSKRGGTFLKLVEPATFGTSQAAAATVGTSTFPMIQRMASAMPVFGDIHQIYTTQAIPEPLAKAFFHSATTLAGVRGVPQGLQCHALTAACILGTNDSVRRSIVESGHVDPADYKDTTFMTLVTSTRHYVRPVTGNTAYPKFSKYTDKNGHPFVTLARRDLPKGVTEIEELGLEIIWLQETTGSYGVVFQLLRQAFKLEPIKSYFVGGIPLEMAISPADFRNHSQHLLATSKPLDITIVCNVRSCLPVRDVLFQLSLSPGNSNDPHKFLAGVFLLHAAQATDGTVRPWAVLFVWNTISPSLDLHALQSLAGPGAALKFHSTDRLASLATMGVLQFIRLGQAGKSSKSGKGPVGKMVAKSQAGSPKGQKAYPPEKSIKKSESPTYIPRMLYAPPTLSSSNFQGGNFGARDRHSDNKDVTNNYSGDNNSEDSMDEQDDNIDYSSVDTSSTTPSTVAVITAAKASPLLNLTSSDVHELSDEAVVHLGDSDAGMQLIERMIKTSFAVSVQPTIQDLQAQIRSTQQLAANADLRQLAQEFRSNRRAHQESSSTLEDLIADSQATDAPPSINRQITRAQFKTQKLRQDMMNVLNTLHDGCTRYGLDINDFVTREDSDLLTQLIHE